MTAAAPYVYYLPIVLSPKHTVKLINSRRFFLYIVNGDIIDMKKKLFLVLILLIGLITSCKDKNKVFEDLEVEQMQTEINVNETVSIKITSGSGDYQVKAYDENIVSVFLEGNVIKIEGVSKGSSTIKVYDTRSFQTVNIIVYVADECKYSFVTSKIIEAKVITSNNGTKNIPNEEVRNMWGERLTLNTPIELCLRNDSLLILKPHNVTEKHQVLWRDNNLFLKVKNSEEWALCGMRNPDGTKILLNFGLVKGNLKNEVRTLEVLRQGYHYNKYTDVINSPDATVLWTKVNFEYKKK